MRILTSEKQSLRLLKPPILTEQELIKGLPAVALQRVRPLKAAADEARLQKRLTHY